MEQHRQLNDVFQLSFLSEGTVEAQPDARRRIQKDFQPNEAPNNQKLIESCDSKNDFGDKEIIT